MKKKKKIDGWTLYVHTNKFDGKKYVGITSKTPQQRWQNGKGYLGNKYFTRAINKYGWNEGFTHEILLTGLTQQEAADKERAYIGLYQSNNPKYGYNQTSGGFGYDLALETQIREEFGIGKNNKFDLKVKLLPLWFIKQNPLLLKIFIELLKTALGGEELKETVTRIYYENGKEVKKEVETKTTIRKPNKRAIDVVLHNYSEDKELESIIKKLKYLKEQGDFEEEF